MSWHSEICHNLICYIRCEVLPDDLFLSYQKEMNSSEYIFLFWGIVSITTGFSSAFGSLNGKARARWQLTLTATWPIVSFLSDNWGPGPITEAAMETSNTYKSMTGLTHDWPVQASTFSQQFECVGMWVWENQIEAIVLVSWMKNVDII